MEKTYWFSFEKHAHDLYFRRNALYNRMAELDEFSAEYNKLEKEFNALTSVLDYAFAPCAKIPANLYRYAINAVSWAETTRAELNTAVHYYTN